MKRNLSSGRAIRATAKTLFSTMDRMIGPFPGPRILIYHQIAAGNGKQMDLPSVLFIRQLDWLQAHGQIVSLSEALARRSESSSSSLFVLTFDDGYQDMFMNGFPVLAERRLPFVVYLATHSVDSGSPLATDRVATPITWEQVTKMCDTGLVTLGAHTHSHLDLRRAPEAHIEEELRTSNRLIEERVGSAPKHFAYPWGYWSSVGDRLVRQIYVSAALGGGKPIGPGSDPHLLHRIPIQQSDGMVFFGAKIRRGQRTEEWARRLAAGYRGP